MLREQRPLSELVDEVFEAVPQVLVNVALPERRPLKEMARTRKVIEHAERSLGAGGRVLVRWSGTEPKLRVMVEGPNETAIRNLANSIAAAATQELRPTAS
jgi:phosphoglucosamine mutase